MDLHDELDQLRALRDEIHLQMKLGAAEARQKLEPLEARFGEIEGRLRQLTAAGREELADVRAAAQLLVGEIREGFGKLRERL